MSRYVYTNYIHIIYTILYSFTYIFMILFICDLEHENINIIIRYWYPIFAKYLQLPKTDIAMQFHRLIYPLYLYTWYLKPYSLLLPPPSVACSSGRHCRLLLPLLLPPLVAPTVVPTSPLHADVAFASTCCHYLQFLVAVTTQAKATENNNTLVTAPAACRGPAGLTSFSTISAAFDVTNYRILCLLPLLT